MTTDTNDTQEILSMSVLKSFSTLEEPASPSQNTAANGDASASATASSGGSKGPSSSDMLFYYERLLPFTKVFQWLNHSPKVGKDFTMREFAFEFRSGAYQRYNSFNNQEDFKKSVVRSNPMRFEVGAVYNLNPKERKNLSKLALKPISKELVFDIDLTDYDEIRTCCSGTAICMKCWKFIQVATKIIDACLKEDFGFKHLIWVFSGRRGAHCWVSDKRARELDETARRSIVEYLDVVGLAKHSKSGTKLSLKKPYHPHVDRSFGILKTEFTSIILKEQDPWNTYEGGASYANEDKINELLGFLPEKSLQEELRRKWAGRGSTSLAKWEDINVVATKTLKNQIQVTQLNDAKKDIILYYMYPRLDMEVSKQVIHLLKSPFCIHPGTGNVCVPFDPLNNIDGNPDNDLYGFNPTNSPNLRQLQEQIEEWEMGTAGTGTDRKVQDYERTSLKPYVEYFGKFVSNLVKEELGKREREDEMDF